MGQALLFGQAINVHRISFILEWNSWPHPPKHYLKTLNVEADKDHDDEEEVTKTITLQEVFQNRLKEAPLLWAKERDRKLKELTFRVPKSLEEQGKDAAEDADIC